MHLKLFRNKRILTAVLSASLGIALLGGCSSSTETPHGETENPEFEAYLDELFQNDITCNTLNLHYTLEDPQSFGIEEYIPTLGDLSEETRKSTRSNLKESKKELNSFSYRSLSTREQLTFDILADYLDTQIALCDYELYQEILTPNNGIQSQLPILLAEYKFNCKQDVEDYLALLAQMDTYYSQILDFEEEKKEAGLFMSDERCLEVIAGCESFIEDPENHFLLTTFDQKIQSVPNLTEEEITMYTEENRTCLAKHVIPAYQMLISGLTAMLGSGQNEQGLYYFKDGRDYYELLVQSDTGCSDSVEEINDAISTMRDNDLRVCADLLAKDPEIFEECAAFDWNFAEETQMLNTLQTVMLDDFPAPVDTAFSISYVDESLQDSLAPAFYITAPIDNYLENTIYINSASDYSDIYYFTTLAHEGFPGHLYQTVMSYSYGLEPVRTILDYPGYIEGWATYVEMMSYYYAGLDEDIASMLQHNQSAILSLYATADIGIHYFGWDDETIYGFWSSYGITDAESIDEITGLIISDPGNYLKYYVGYLQFAELRDQMQETYGNDFSLKSFHEALLRIGPAPFSIIEEHFNEYYSPQKDS